MMRKGAKHRVGGAVRERERERRKERSCRGERGGVHMVGRLEEGLDGQRERRGQEKKKGET